MRKSDVCVCVTHQVFQDYKSVRRPNIKSRTKPKMEEYTLIDLIKTIRRATDLISDAVSVDQKVIDGRSLYNDWLRAMQMVIDYIQCHTSESDIIDTLVSALVRACVVVMNAYPDKTHRTILMFARATQCLYTTFYSYDIMAVFRHFEAHLDFLAHLMDLAVMCQGCVETTWIVWKILATFATAAFWFSDVKNDVDRVCVALRTSPTVQRTYCVMFLSQRRTQDFWAEKLSGSDAMSSTIKDVIIQATETRRLLRDAGIMKDDMKDGRGSLLWPLVAVRKRMSECDDDETATGAFDPFLETAGPEFSGFFLDAVLYCVRDLLSHTETCPADVKFAVEFLMTYGAGPASTTAQRVSSLERIFEGIDLIVRPMSNEWGSLNAATCAVVRGLLPVVNAGCEGETYDSTVIEAIPFENVQKVSRSVTQLIVRLHDVDVNHPSLTVLMGIALWTFHAICRRSTATVEARQRCAVTFLESVKPVLYTLLPHSSNHLCRVFVKTLVCVWKPLSLRDTTTSERDSIIASITQIFSVCNVSNRQIRTIFGYRRPAIAPPRTWTSIGV